MNNNSILADIKNRYASGERQFNQVELRRANLKGIDLSYADLSGADLSYASLRGANLRGANLQNAYLNEADLSEANLEEANLSNSSLIKAYFLKTNLQKANLNQAYLTSACLCKANLEKAILTGTYLNHILLNGANCQDALYDSQTQFDCSFDPIKAQMRKIYLSKPSLDSLTINIQELLMNFNYISQCGTSYLGRPLMMKYWLLSRPHSDCLNQFQIDDLAQIKYVGNLNDNVNLLQFKYSQQWANNLIKNCSSIIKNFIDLVDLKYLIFEINNQK